MKKILVFASALAICASAFAQTDTETKKSAPASHFKLYGFIRNYFAYDSHESIAGTGDLYYYMPKDQNMVDGKDLNQVSSFRFLSLTSRVGIDVSGYEMGGYKFGAKVEADFYSGISGVTGTATLRLRQAYATVAKDGRSWKIGQAWHPLAADLPDIFSLESGVPFQPFSRTPQVTFDQKLGGVASLTASALWQMQYTSTGPDGASANYIKYSCTPELYLGLNFKWDKTLFRIGADMLSIKPRNYNTLKTAKVSDRITTVNVMEYFQANAGAWTFRQKLVYANDGSHMNLIGGYGVSGINTDGSWNYTATRNISTWVTAKVTPKGSKWTAQMLVGYMNNLGTSKEIVGEGWYKNNASTIKQMYRIQPECLYTIGKFQIGLEYMFTSVNYGKADNHMHAVDNLHWVNNHRVQSLIKFNF